MEVDEHMHTKFIQFDPAPRRGGPNSKEVSLSRLRARSLALALSLSRPLSLRAYVCLWVAGWLGGWVGGWVAFVLACERAVMCMYYVFAYGYA
jgi:hypothetical protein